MVVIEGLRLNLAPVLTKLVSMSSFKVYTPDLECLEIPLIDLEIIQSDPVITYVEEHSIHWNGVFSSFLHEIVESFVLRIDFGQYLSHEIEQHHTPDETDHEHGATEDFEHDWFVTVMGHSDDEWSHT